MLVALQKKLGAVRLDPQTSAFQARLHEKLKFPQLESSIQVRAQVWGVQSGCTQLYTPLAGEVKQALVPTKLKAVKQKIISVSLGPEHAACLTEAGNILTFGSNTAAQLGRGHSKQGVMPGVVSTYIPIHAYISRHTMLCIYLHMYP